MMAYERLTEPLAARSVYMKRVATNLGITGSLMLVSLAFGMAGYKTFGPMGWEDAFANASMIMSGMGPLADLKTASGKVFEGAYALYSGLFLIISASLILGPVVHRFLHQMHLADEDESGGDDQAKSKRKPKRS
jgi:ammonia channel protein AmtB